MPRNVSHFCFPDKKKNEQFKAKVNTILKISRRRLLMVEIELSNLVVDVAQSELLDTVVYVDDSIENLVFIFIVTYAGA